MEQDNNNEKNLKLNIAEKDNHQKENKDIMVTKRKKPPQRPKLPTWPVKPPRKKKKSFWDVFFE